MKNKTAAMIGTGFAYVLAFLFIILKICGVISWPWGWVLSPIWIHAIIMAAVYAFVILQPR